MQMLLFTIVITTVITTCHLAPSGVPFGILLGPTFTAVRVFSLWSKTPVSDGAYPGGWGSSTEEGWLPSYALYDAYPCLL